MCSKRVMMSGYFGFDNAGDEAICAAIIGTLRELDPTLEFVILSANPEKTKEQYAVDAIARMDLRAIYRELKHTDLFISGGGSLLQDKTGNLTIPYYLAMIQMARWAKVPVAVYAQGIGPVDRPVFKRWIGNLFKKLQYVSVRDQESKQLLVSWRVPAERIDEVVDPVFLLQSHGADAGKTLLENEGISLNKAPILFSIRRWKEGAGDFRTIAEVCDRLIEQGEEVLFVPFHFPEDLEASIEIISFMHKPAQVVQENYQPAELMDIVANGKAMVGMRLHALIFAAARGIPCVGISYDPKIDAFLGLMDQKPAGYSGSLSAHDLHAALVRVLQAEVPAKESSRTRDHIRMKARRPAEEVIRLLQR